MTRPHRDPFGLRASIHGNGRRPSRADRTPLDLEAIKAWTARQEANNRAYYERREYLESARYENRWFL